MSEPKRDDGAVDACLQELHGSRVTKHMRCHPFVLKRRAFLSRRSDVLGQQKLHSVRAQASPPRARKQDVSSVAPRFPQPPFESVDALLGQWGTSLFSAFAHAAYVRAGSQHDIRSMQAGHLGKPQASLNGNQQEGAISAAGPGVEIGHRQNGFDFGPGQESNQLLLVTLRRHCQNALDQAGLGGLLIRSVPVEGPDRSQPQIAASRTVASVFF